MILFVICHWVGIFERILMFADAANYFELFVHCKVFVWSVKRVKTICAMHRHPFSSIHSQFCSWIQSHEININLFPFKIWKTLFVVQHRSATLARLKRRNWSKNTFTNYSSIMLVGTCSLATGLSVRYLSKELRITARMNIRADCTLSLALLWSYCSNSCRRFRENA